MPKSLGTAEFAVVHFQLEFQEAFRGGREALLGLRRGLRRAARQVLAAGGEERFGALFDPPPAADPAARCRYQRPGPPFAILSASACPPLCEVGDVFDLTATFWGDGVRMVEDFGRALQALGTSGLSRGEGVCELVAVEAEDAAGRRHCLWRGGDDFCGLQVPRCDVAWWLEGALTVGPQTLEFATPARLMHRGSPLFRPSFQRLFPFVLRRVSSMLHAHCGLEVVDDPRPLLQAAAEVVVSGNRLTWEDWRTLEREGGGQDLGGVAGTVDLEGEALADVAWLLKLGSLMNLGKGAAYGAGSYLLRAG